MYDQIHEYDFSGGVNPRLDEGFNVIPMCTLKVWASPAVGLLHEKGRIRGRGTGKILVDEKELENVLRSRRRRGRPRKEEQTFEDETVYIIIAQERGDIILVDTLEEAASNYGLSTSDLLTVRDVAEQYHLSSSTIRRWSISGPEGQPYLPALQVRLKHSGSEGGELLFRKEDVESLKANPPKMGGRRQRRNNL